MKTFLISAIAATLVAGPLAATAAEAQRRETTTVVRERPNGRTVVRQRTVTRQPQYRARWNRGERFDRRQARNYRQIDYRRYRGLRAPPRGYSYYQSGNDAVLVAVATGVIAGVFAGAIR